MPLGIPGKNKCPASYHEGNQQVGGMHLPLDGIDFEFPDRRLEPICLPTRQKAKNLKHLNMIIITTPLGRLGPSAGTLAPQDLNYIL